MKSVLMKIRHCTKFSVKTAVLLPSLSLFAVFIYPNFKNMMKKSCERIRKVSRCQKRKSRYQNASLTVEASIAFPVFFFAVLYLIQMFGGLRAELTIAQAGITSAREVAAYSYVAERLADGESAAADTILKVFDQKIVRDAAITSVFYARCDNSLLKEAGVAQGLGGIWVDSKETGEKTRAEIFYRVKPANVLTKERNRYYVLRIVYRNWTGEGKVHKAEEENAGKSNIVYMTEHGAVYHLSRTCSHIKIDIEAVRPKDVGERRNLSGAKYYACEFCSPELSKLAQVYITEYGTRYHAFSSCSAIKRNVRECSLEEVGQTYPACSRCGKKEEGEM